MRKFLLATALLLCTGAALAQTYNITGTLNGMPGGNYNVSGTATLNSNGTYTVSGTLTPPCTEITAPTGSLTDSGGAVWTWGASGGSGNYHMLRNNVDTTGMAQVLAVQGSNVYAKANWGSVSWWQYGGGTTWTQLTAAPAGCN